MIGKNIFKIIRTISKEATKQMKKGNIEDVLFLQNINEQIKQHYDNEYTIGRN